MSNETRGGLLETGPKHDNGSESLCHGALGAYCFGKLLKQQVHRVQERRRVSKVNAGVCEKCERLLPMMMGIQ